MDVDISDILADISRPTSETPYAPLTPQYSQPYQPYEPEAAYTDHILLTRHWITERCTPSLQAYPTPLITRMMNRIRSQISRIEDLTSGIYDTPSGDPPANLNLTLSILQTDLSRTQFLIRSYLRQRLAKITKFATYHTKHHLHPHPHHPGNSNNDNDTDTDNKPRLLSAEETQFLEHHNHILATLYQSSFLASLPPGLRRLDDSSGGSARMDQGPEPAAGVLVRCLARDWSNEDVVRRRLREPDAGEEEEEEEGGSATVELRCERGGVLVARWRDVKGGVEGGLLEVL